MCQNVQYFTKLETELLHVKFLKNNSKDYKNMGNISNYKIKIREFTCLCIL